MALMKFLATESGHYCGESPAHLASQRECDHGSQRCGLPRVRFAWSWFPVGQIPCAKRLSWTLALWMRVAYTCRPRRLFKQHWTRIFNHRRPKTRATMRIYRRNNSSLRRVLVDLAAITAPRFRYNDARCKSRMRRAHVATSLMHISLNPVEAAGDMRTSLCTSLGRSCSKTRSSTSAARNWRLGAWTCSRRSPRVIMITRSCMHRSGKCCGENGRIQNYHLVP